MKANELRIGNYVQYEGQTYKMAVTSTEGEPGLDTIEYGYGVVEWRDLKPIPLTEEWLIKFGFESYLDGYRSKRIKKELYIANNPHGFWFAMDEKEDEDGRIIDERAIKLNIKHVHQLQNLYFALTGEELKLNRV